MLACRKTVIRRRMPRNAGCMVKHRLVYFLLGGIILTALALGLYSCLRPQEPVIALLSITDDIRNGQVEWIGIDRNLLQVRYQDGTVVWTQKEPEATLVEQLIALGVTRQDLDGVEIVLTGPSTGRQLSSGLTVAIQVLLIGGLLLLVFAKAPGRADSPLFARSKNRSQVEHRPEVTFDDVAGVDEAKVELQEIVTFLKEPERFRRLGARTPKGVLLVGPPGTGKTLLAKAIAGESRVPFFNMSGSEFVEMYVGVGASRVRKLFTEAKKSSPSIVFIDEIDAVGRHREASVHSQNGEREQTLNQILVEIDGFGSDAGVIVVAATNRADVLDAALLRPGRFDRQVTLSAPDVKGREETFLVHLKDKIVDEAVNAHDLARCTPGFVGADIENVVNEAAILAVRGGRDCIGLAEFEAAIERVMAGPEKRGRIISEKERRIVAYHETGHAVAAHTLPECDPVRKVSIVARGAAAGYTMTLPEQDHLLLTSTKLKHEMAFMLGGRAAEDALLGEVTTGASSDLMKATELARRMVMEYGMSAEIGPLSYARGSGFYEHDLKNCSENQAARIDKEVERLVEEAYACARSLIGQHRQAIAAVVDVLLVQETLSGDEFRSVFEEASRRALSS